MVTDEQVKLMRQKRMEGKTQETAAAVAGMSVRTARNWETGLLPSQTKETRPWRTRSDPFEEVWDSEIIPLLKADEEGKLQTKAIFAELLRRHPGEFSDGQLRTLQRRVRDWRAVQGPPKEVYFEQEHPPGREGVFDFTHCDSLNVTIVGVMFAHLLFTFKLSFSGWTWVCLAFGETFEALASSLQGALWALGEVPEIVRHDNLSAATHELKRSGGRSLNRRFKDILDHYDLDSTRINPGKSNENGVAEKSNNLIKTALEQALQFRGSREFGTRQEYEDFVHEVIERDRNQQAAGRLAIERKDLRPLPSAPVPSYTKHTPKVRRWSTIRVARRQYSVPSRLIGHQVVVLQHADVLEVFYKEQLVETLPRLRGNESVRIDYRHVIWSLIRKPGAFAQYKHREELFPTLTFRLAYDALKIWKGERADIEYVRILHLAAATMESRVGEALEILLEYGERFEYIDVKELSEPEPRHVPNVKIPAPDIASYDQLLGGVR